jgi:hypothetical protein
MPATGTAICHHMGRRESAECNDSAFAWQIVDCFYFYIILPIILRALILPSLCISARSLTIIVRKIFEYLNFRHLHFERHDTEEERPARTLPPSVVKYRFHDTFLAVESSRCCSISCSVRRLNPLFCAYCVHYAGDNLHEGPRSALGFPRQHGSKSVWRTL